MKEYTNAYCKKDYRDLIREYLVEGLDKETWLDHPSNEFIKVIFKQYITDRMEEYRKSHTFPCGACSELHEVILPDGTKVTVTCL